MKSELRNTLYSSVAMYTEFVLGMVTSILIARHMGPDAFGSYSAAIWLVALGVALVNSGTASGAIRFIAEFRGSGKQNRIGILISRLESLQRIYLLLVLVGLALLMVFAGDAIVPVLDRRLLFGFLVVAVAMRSSYMFRIGVIKGNEDFRSVALIALVASPLNLLMVLLVILLGMPEHWFFLAFIASSLVFFALSRWQTRQYLVDKAGSLDDATSRRLRRQVAYSTAIVSLGFISASELEVTLLSMFGSAHGAGQFKVAHQLATGAAMLVPGVFAALMLPFMARALGEGEHVAGRKFATSTTYLMFLAAPLAAFACVLGPVMVRLLYGGAYEQAAVWFPAVLICTCLLASTAAGSSLLLSADRQSSILALLAGCAVVKLALGGVLVHAFSLTGAMITFVVTSLLNAFVTMHMAARLAKAPLEWGRMRSVVFASIIAAAITYAGTLWLAPFPAVFVGAALFALAYIGSTILLGYWQEDDLEVVASLVRRLPANVRGLGDWTIRMARARGVRSGGSA